MLLNGAYELERNKDMVNSLNVFPVPDGDTGTNMSATMLSAVEEIKKLKNISVQTVVNAASMGSLMGARGNSGVILSQILRGFSKYLKNKANLTTKDFALALKEGANTAYRAVMKPTEGTILTVARESADKAIEIAKNEVDFLNFMKKVYDQAVLTLNKTPDMLPVLKQAGVVDAGGKGLVVIYSGILKWFQGEVISPDTFEVSNKVTKLDVEKVEDIGNIKFGYCTEFFIKTGNAVNYNSFKDRISSYGDSIVVVGMENLIKVHIHTNNPGIILEEAVKLGELSKIKIDNMKEQHRSLIEDEEEKKLNVIEPVKEEEKEYGIITVAAGDGITSIFKDLGVDIVIEGGQTMNPSTQNILEAINSINAKNIFILPNNGNIVMAAQQARDVSNKNVIVIPTKSIPQGITAVVTFNPDIDVKENEQEMLKAISKVKTGQITYAVRDTVFNDVDIKEGNILGIFNGKLIKSGEDINQITKEVLDEMVDENSELITIFYGNGLEEKDTNEISDYVKEKFNNCDVSINYGGQPLYYYVISVE
ncbi:DAK2 domain-containing protein [Caloramator sp. E03]|nr:DAK2 domain-containing protein [Caloramator sp. E03]QCX34751.1 DAK2 domain-containing protein [Caloramator sp. E03]